MLQPSVQVNVKYCPSPGVPSNLKVLVVAVAASLAVAGLAPSAEMVPVYEWDPHWPVRPLPNHWTLGQVAGVEVDRQDHVWILHRPRTIEGTALDALDPVATSECCVPAPSVVEFDQSGKVVQAWGGPKAEDFGKSGGVPPFSRRPCHGSRPPFRGRTRSIRWSSTMRTTCGSPTMWGRTSSS